MSAAERARYLPMILSSAGQHDSAKKVADLLAELDQVKADRDQANYDRGVLIDNEKCRGVDAMVRHVADQRNEALAERDAALATLAEVREMAIHIDGQIGADVRAALDRGPR